MKRRRQNDDSCGISSESRGDNINRNLVNILVDAFFDLSGTAMFCGGAERYIIELHNLIRTSGYEVRIYQHGDADWVRYYHDIKIEGIGSKGDIPTLQNRFHAEKEMGILTIHSPFTMSDKHYQDKAIGISHGIYWDHPCHQSGVMKTKIYNAIRDCDVIVSVDTNTINWVRTEMPEEINKLIYVPNFVDHKIFFPEDISSKTLVVLFPRRLCKERGFLLVSDIVPSLIQRYQHIEFHFVGKVMGDESVSDKVEELRNKYNDRVRFYVLPPEDMKSAYDKADIVLIPTLNGEGTSLSCLEAMASGKPVIASNVGGLSDLIIDGYNGFLISPNKEELESRLIKLLENEQLRKEFGHRACEVSKSFSLDLWRQRWTELLTRVLDSSHYIIRTHSRNTQIMHPWEQIFNLEKQTGILQGQLQERDLQLQERDIQLQERDLQLQERDLQLQERDSQLQERNTRIEELSRELGFIQSSLNELNSRLLQVYSSKTWKIGQFYGRILGVSSPIKTKLISGIRKLFGKKDRVLLKADKKDNTTSPVISEIEVLNLPPGALVGNKYDIFVFPMINFSFRYQRPQQLASCFAKMGHRVFYLNFAEFVSPNSKEEFKINDIKENVYEVFLKSPSSLDIYGGKLNNDVLKCLYLSINSLRKQYGLMTVVSLVHNPFWTPLAFKMREDYGWKVMYDCMDDWDGDIFRGIGKPVIDKEKNLARNADLLTVTADLLYKKWHEHNRTCTLIRNAADYEHFKEASPNSLLTDIKKPIVGFFGGIADWIDIESIHYVATNRKDLSFVFLGGIFTDVSSIEKLHNVYLLGNQPYELMPSYLFNFDLCIIPVKKTKITEAMDHVKLYEYFTSGKPVIARAIHEIKQYKDLVYLYESKEEFLECINKALNERDMDIMERRKAIIASNTWNERVMLIDEKIKDIYGKASIVIVTINNLKLNKMCIESILSKTDYPNYEITIVDNASTDGTREYLKELGSDFDSIKVILNDENEGFPKANNIGIKASEGDYIIFLNNDTIVTKGWLTKLVNYLDRFQDIGLIGPITNFCANEARIDVNLTSPAEIDNFAFSRMLTHEGLIHDIEMLAFYCVAMRKELIDEVGLLEEKFGVGMFEDDDYSHRVSLKGYRVVYAEDIFVYHFGKQSFKKLEVEEKYNEVFYRNKKIFEEKWKMQWKDPKDNSSSQKINEDIQAVQISPSQSEYRYTLDRILEENQNAKGIIVYAPAMEWNVPLLQRPQHIALQMANQGYLYFHCTSNINYDKCKGFEKISDKCYVTDQHDLIIQSNPPFIYNLNSICPRKIDHKVFGQINENHLTVYDYIDHIHEYISGPTTEFIYKRHVTINPDIITCTAGFLVEEMLQRFPSDKVFYLPNAVDYDHFHIKKDSVNLPDDIKNIVSKNKPIIGYFGALARWIDYDLINLLVEERHDAEIILISWDFDGTQERLKRSKNLHVIGPISYNILPQYAIWFDIAIIPFGDPDISLTTSPIKLFEYMALGKPIVTTDMRECKKYQSVLAAATHKEFLILVDKALKLKDDNDYLNLLDSEAKQNTWEARASELDKAITRALAIR